MPLLTIALDKEPVNAWCPAVLHYLEVGKLRVARDHQIFNLLCLILS